MNLILPRLAARSALQLPAYDMHGIEPEFNLLKLLELNSIRRQIDTFHRRLLSNKSTGTFDQSYYWLFYFGSQDCGPFHPAFGNMTTSFPFATFTVTIDEDEDTRELSALLRHFQDWVLRFPIPTQLTYDSNEADVVLGLEHWYEYHYKAVMTPALVMRAK